MNFRPERTLDYMRITGRWWELDTMAEVARAVGMVSVQLECSPEEAATVLRGYAAAHAQSPADLALDIIDRTLSFAS